MNTKQHIIQRFLFQLPKSLLFIYIPPYPRDHSDQENLIITNIHISKLSSLTADFIIKELKAFIVRYPSCKRAEYAAAVVFILVGLSVY